jgi:pimeloyl-ACP methyl ester carboxylesterase
MIFFPLSSPLLSLCHLDDVGLGLTDVHLVGHSLGGKVAAVAALQLVELSRKEEEALQTQSAGEKEQTREGESAVDLSGLKLKVLSLTLIDVSPVDYEGDEAFADVLHTLDIVEDLNGYLPNLGQGQGDGDTGKSNSRSGQDVSVADVRVLLNGLLSERVPDPMLKAFLMASIQPREDKILGPGFQGLSFSMRVLMQRIKASRDTLRLAKGQGQVQGASVETGAHPIPVPLSVPVSGGFEWKFSVEGISGFRNKLCGWPNRYSTQKRDESSPLTPYLEPVLLMKGANSKFVRSSHIPQISSMFPSFTLLTVRDAGHWLHFEKPNESSESLIRFIRRVEERERERGTTNS